MDFSRVVLGSKLVDDLAQLGVAKGDLLMVHESVRKVGWVVGGPTTLLQSLLSAVGDEGTILKLIGSEDGTYEMNKWPAEVRDAYLRERPAYDQYKTPADRSWGICCEYLRTWPGAKRSQHPEASFAAVGKLAAWVTEEHSFSHGYGKLSPLKRLLDAHGKVLLLGCPLEMVTLLHHAEYNAKLPHKRSVNYRAPILQNGARVWIEIEELDSSNGIVAWPGQESGDDYFARIVGDAIKSGLARCGRVGFAEAHLFDARALHDFGTSWMEKELLPFATEAL